MKVWVSVQEEHTPNCVAITADFNLLKPGRSRNLPQRAWKSACDVGRARQTGSTGRWNRLEFSDTMETRCCCSLAHRHCSWLRTRLLWTQRRTLVNIPWIPGGVQHVLRSHDRNYECMSPHTGWWEASEWVSISDTWGEAYLCTLLMSAKTIIRKHTATSTRMWAEYLQGNTSSEKMGTGTRTWTTVSFIHTKMGGGTSLTRWIVLLFSLSNRGLDTTNTTYHRWENRLSLHTHSTHANSIKKCSTFFPPKHDSRESVIRSR